MRDDYDLFKLLQDKQLKVRERRAGKRAGQTAEWGSLSR